MELTALGIAKQAHQFKKGDVLRVKSSMRSNWSGVKSMTVSVARRTGHNTRGIPLYAVVGDKGSKYSEEWFELQSAAPKSTARNFGRSKDDIQADSIARKLVDAIVLIETSNVSPDDILEAVKAHVMTKNMQGVRDAVQALVEYYKSDDDKAHWINPGGGEGCF